MTMQPLYRPLVRKFKRLPTSSLLPHGGTIVPAVVRSNSTDSPEDCVGSVVPRELVEGTASLGTAQHVEVFLTDGPEAEGSMVDLTEVELGKGALCVSPVERLLPPWVVDPAYHPVPQDVLVEEVVLLPGGCEVGTDAMVDLTEEFAPCRRHSMGRWSLSDSRCGGFVLSRVVGPDELDRNTTRIPAFGWCGYLSLEWAERQSRGVGGDGLNLRLSHSRERMTSFVGGLLAASMRFAENCWVY